MLSFWHNSIVVNFTFIFTIIVTLYQLSKIFWFQYTFFGFPSAQVKTKSKVFICKQWKPTLNNMISDLLPMTDIHLYSGFSFKSEISIFTSGDKIKFWVMFFRIKFTRHMIMSLLLENRWFEKDYHGLETNSEMIISVDIQVGGLLPTFLTFRIRHHYY